MLSKKPQELMISDGAPEGIVNMSQQERAQVWKENPPKPMPAFNAPTKSKDPETLKVLEEINNKKTNKTKTRIKKMLDKQIDRTGQRWDGRKGIWIDEHKEKEQRMISIRTNTRGSTQMAKKDYAEMTGPELVAAYNKRSGKPAIKKFKDKAAGLAAMAKLDSEKAAKAKAKGANGAAKKAKEPKEASANKLAAEFGCRVGSFREKLIIAFDDNYRKFAKAEDLLKAVYGSKNNENTGALTMVIKGAEKMITKGKLAYELKKDKDAETKTISYGLWPK